MIGVAIGPIVGGITASVWDLRGLFFLYSIFAFMSYILSHIYIKENKSKQVEAPPSKTYDTGIRKMYVLSFFNITLLVFGFTVFANHMRFIAKTPPYHS